MKMMRLLSFTAASVVAVASLVPQTAHADDGPVQVFILAGQSNMVGSGGKTDYGRNPAGGSNIYGGIGSLRWFVNNEAATFGYGGTDALVDINGDFLTRSDVQIYSHIEVTQDASPDGLSDGTMRSGDLDVGYGRVNGAGGEHWIGPRVRHGHGHG